MTQQNDLIPECPELEELNKRKALELKLARVTVIDSALDKVRDALIDYKLGNGELCGVANRAHLLYGLVNAICNEDEYDA